MERGPAGGVEGDGRVPEAGTLGLVGVEDAEHLEPLVVGGGDDKRAHLHHVLEGRLRERGALRRIGPREELVEQTEHGAAVHLPRDLLEDAAQDDEVPREARQRALEALRVADGDGHGRKRGDDAPVADRRGEARAREQGHEARRLQSDRLPAGVGAGDDERAGGAEGDVVADDAAGGAARAQGLVVQELEQRVARVLQREHPPGGIDLGATAVDAGGEGAPREGGLDAARAGEVREQAAAELGHLEAQLTQDALLLLLDVGAGDLDAVAELEQRARLHVDGLVGLRRVVDDALDARLELGLHGQHVAVVAHREVAVAQQPGLVEVPHERRELILRLGAQRAHLLPEREQLRRGVVGHLPLLVERAQHAFDEAPIVVDLRAHDDEARRALGLEGDDVVQASERVEGLGDVDDVDGPEHHPLAGGVDDVAHVVDAAEVRGDLALHRRPRLERLFEPCVHGVERGGERIVLQGEEAEGGLARRREHLLDLGEAEVTRGARGQVQGDELAAHGAHPRPHRRRGEAPFGARSNRRARQAAAEGRARLAPGRSICENRAVRRLHRPPLLVVAALASLAAFAAGCASAPPPHRTHLGAVLDLPGDDVELAPAPEEGRTDDDRARAKQLLADGARLRDQGDLAGSQKALEQALQLDASLARAHVEWALTSEGLGVDPALVAAHYQLGARLAPDDARAQTLAASWAERHGDVTRALEGYDRAIAADPRSVEALCRKAGLLLTRGDPAAAVTSYERALAVDDQSVPALMGLAHAAEVAGDADKAEHALRSLVTRFPTATIYRSRLIELFHRTGQTAKARAAQRELDKLLPKDTRHLRKLRKRRRH